ncbi:hypothetical protein F4553_007709 [Allocatelliglobosispora scoriae]|uniref:Uncharacterized protein n=1 Tax=Allocatelliglobosispora scoriae TaxID=643052 RepID=A0A841C2Y8_9ACTN|nr:hypothetical protein [Allocatelliglobosispora scoriae]MBB5874275.1 hypothetical protein [Allocatelliglobosispora scoriae]
MNSRLLRRSELDWGFAALAVVTALTAVPSTRPILGPRAGSMTFQEAGLI